VGYSTGSSGPYNKPLPVEQWLVLTCSAYVCFILFHPAILGTYMPPFLEKSEDTADMAVVSTSMGARLVLGSGVSISSFLCN
jgi:hypothetical protein